MNEPELLTTEDEIDLLARLLTAEQGYNADEMDYYMTGSVIINRIKSEKFPNSLYEVVFQSGQYQCVSNNHINREYDDVAWEVAEELLEEGTTIDERVTYQAEFEQGRGVYEKRGRTYYCYQ
jgi:N-acetylmuramoyl-L-alanine amidase